MITLAGVFTSAQKLATRRAHRVRGSRLQKRFGFIYKIDLLFAERAVTARLGVFFDKEVELDRDDHPAAAGSTHGRHPMELTLPSIALWRPTKPTLGSVRM